ncbi:MAG: hypothetical protein FWF36_10525 [Propionibacteriaceae bacterium]|nr:hypothetical protein [Propionibacteriaceae bacterium]
MAILSKADTGSLMVSNIVATPFRVDGLIHAFLTIRTAGGTIEFRGPRRGIEAARRILGNLVSTAAAKTRSVPRLSHNFRRRVPG